MSPELRVLWQELLGDFASAGFLWQAAVIAFSLLLAWSINGLLRAYVMRQAPESWKVGIDALNRVLFPLSSLVLVYAGQLVLHHWQHVNLLRLAATLLWAMAAIRLAVYALRFIFAPSAWVRTMENAIASTVWAVLALHLSGLLPEIMMALQDVSFNIGAHEVTLLLVLQAVMTILLTLFLALWISRIIENRLMRSAHFNMNMRVVLSKIVRIVLSFVAILLALSAVGLDITLLSVFGGALGVGIGFGLQKIASNYVSGFIILTDNSMQMGDVITIDGHYGVISDLRSRYMMLRKLDGTQVVIPNETLITNTVVNHSFTDRKVRVQMPLQVSYDSPLELAMQLMRDAATNHGRVLDEPAPEVQIKGFGENGIDLNLSIWIPDPEQGSSSLQSSIYLEIWHAFQQNAISIPYPQREVRILGSVKTNAGGMD
ncbi:MAG TPA: mechanosensitive ion channel domain-containing protein [Methylophilaceae bacterium]|nr:mechanosensitive ion channel domain-containing protein [Methylophilaceae bacterium]